VRVVAPGFVCGPVVLLPSPGLTWKVPSVEWLVVWVVFPLAVLAAVGWFGIQIERRVVSEVQDVVDAVVGQLSKVRDEIVARLDEVEVQVIAAGVEDKVDLSGLVAIADALDAIVPDAAVEAEVDVEYEGLDVEFEDEVVEDDVEVVDEPVEDEDK
jgi:hypothetical protein